MIDVQLEKFKQAKGLFGIEAAILARNTKHLGNNFNWEFSNRGEGGRNKLLTKKENGKSSCHNIPKS